MIRASTGRASRRAVARSRRHGLAGWVLQGFAGSGSTAGRGVTATGAFAVFEKLDRRFDRDGNVLAPTWRIVPQDDAERARCRALTGIAFYGPDATSATIYRAQPAGGVPHYGDEVAFLFESLGAIGTYTVEAALHGPSILLESGDALLLESGDRLLTEAA